MSLHADELLRLELWSQWTKNQQKSPNQTYLDAKKLLTATFKVRTTPMSAAKQNIDIISI